MSASGFTPISLYYSSTGAAVPSAGNLVAGELALNTNDGKLYYKNSSGVVTLLAGATSGPAGGSTTQVQYNNAGVLAGITGATTNGTALTLVAPVLGTPASGTVTNLTGTASININGTVGATTQNAGSFTSVAFPIAAVAPASMGIFNAAGTTLTAISGSTGIFFNNAANSTTNLSILNAGSVGIGTSSPSYKLDVSGTGRFTSSLSVLTGATTTAGLIVGADATVANTWTIARDNVTTGDLKFIGNTTERMRIDSSGNVGIGTSSPSQKLEVYAASNSLQIESVVRNDQAGSGVAAIGFNVSSGAAAETTSTKAGIGLVRSAAYGVGSLCFYNNGTGSAGNFTTADERMRIDSSGNVGIGTSSPGYKLDVNGTLGVSGATVYAGSAVMTIGDATRTASSSTTTGAIVCGGGLGVWSNINLGGAVITAAGSVNIPAYTTTGDTDTGLWFPAANTVAASTAGTEALRIDSGGNLRIGTTAGNADAKSTVSQGNVDSSPCFDLYKGSATTTTSQVFMRFAVSAGAGGNGSITANGASAVTFTAWSDRRLKENIVDLPSQIANIMALRPVEFDYIGYENGKGHQLGFIAQEVQEIYPDLVGEGTDGMLTLSDMNKNDARLIKCIQEQQALILALTDRIAALENK